MEVDSVLDKQTVNPAGTLVNYGGSHTVKYPGNPPAPTYPDSSSAPTAQSTLVSHSVDNLGWTEYSSPVGQSSLNMLHLHPFSQASTHSVDSGCSSSSHWVKPHSDTSSHTFSIAPRPPSSASFMDMGKNTHGRRTNSYQIQSSGRRWARNVSDGIPMIVHHAWKGSSRFWRTLVHPPVLSCLDNPKHPDTRSVPSISAEPGDLNPSLSSSPKELPPRPAPFFYPRRVDCEREELSYESTTQDNFFCNLGVQPIHSSSNASKNKSKFLPMSRNTGKQVLRDEDGTSINSDEIETWKRWQNDLATKKSRPSLRQRLGSSLRQSISFQHLRNARSELDVSQLARQQAESETMGPGITDDPFASLLTSPQLLPAQADFLPATGSLPLSATVSSPLLCLSKTVLDLNLETRRRSFMNMDPDGDDPSASSSVSRSDISHQRCTPSPYSNIGCSSVLARPTQPGKNVTLTSVPQSRAGCMSGGSGILCQTPVLTPDLDSTEAFSPSLSDNLCDIQITNNHIHTKSILPFPSLDPSQERSIVPDIFEESAVEEGTSQDQIFYSSALELPHVTSRSLDSGGNKSPKSQRKFSLPSVDGECIANVSIASVDMSESIADFTLLAVEWPLPPSLTSPESGIAHGDKPDLESLAPLQSHRRSYPPTSSMGNKSSLNKLPATVFSKPLPLGISQHPSSVTLSSPIDAVEVKLGSSILKHTDFPNVIVLSSATKTDPAGTSISFRATSLLVLVSFFAFHAETRLEPQRVSGGGTAILANVTLFRDAHDNEVNSNTVTVSLINKDSSFKPTENSLVSFSLDLPIPLSELAVVVAKASFGNGIVSDSQ